MDDFYDLLEVPEDASRADVKRAWREKAREYHPDVNDDDRANVQFKTLQKAYEVLSDETERAAYDRMGHATYVNRRLDGLPTAGMTRPRDVARGSSRWGSGGSSSGSGSGSSSGGRSRSSGASNRTRSGSSGSRSSSSSASSSSGSRTSSRGSSGTRSSGRGGAGSRASSGSASHSSASARSSSSTRSSRRRTASSGSTTGRTSAGSAGGTAGSTSAAAESGTRAADATGARHPLWYGWTAILVAGVAYLAGLAAYLDANAGAVPSFVETLAADPQSALLGGGWFAPPGAFAADAVLAAPASGLSLAFPAGALLLGVVFAAVVAKFGHGKAYLYLAGGLAPVGSLAFGTVVPVAAAGATLALVVLLPVLATTLFLADAGRFLLAEA